MRSDQIIRRLQKHGDRRREALATAEAELQHVAKLVPAAKEAGLMIAEIARLSAVSRPTLYSVLRKHR